MAEHIIYRCLTIAGSDSGGGAGIQADLKTFQAFGTYGMSAITAVTAQNTVGVQAAHELPLEIIQQQIESVVTDIGVDAVKTGMLSSATVVKLVSEMAQTHHLDNLVVDPVMVAKSGDPLLQEEARKTIKEELLPLAKVITPNMHEAETLVGREIHSLEEMEEAAAELHKLGCKWVVVKGGHHTEEDDAVDVIYNGEKIRHLKGKRIRSENTHGTGCTFSSAIAAGLARGQDPWKAISRAKKYITEAIRTGISIGAGHGPTNHSVGMKTPWT
jgi:hydroxymethylpyrimidine/phosphomethylpyrimidine kinase